MINSISIRHIVLIKLMLGTAFASDHGGSLPVLPSTRSTLPTTKNVVSTATPAPVSGSSGTSSSSSSSSSYRLPAQNRLSGQPSVIQREEASYLSRSDLSSLAQTSRGMKRLVDEEMPNSLETWVLDFSNEQQVRTKIAVLRRGIQRVGAKLKLQNATAANIADLINSGVLARAVSLDVAGLKLGNLIIIDLVKASPHLVSLNISKTGLRSKGIETLAAELSKCTQLQELDMSFNRLDNVGVAVVVNACPHLASLNIGFTSLTAEGIEPVAKIIANHARLKNLNISSNSELGNRGVAAIVNVCPHLVSLNINSTDLKDEEIETLTAALGTCTQLQELNISGSRLGNEGVAAVVNVCPHLVSLNIGDTGLIAEGIESVAKIIANARLKNLNIGGNSQLGNRGVAAIVNSSSQLVSLNISSTDLTTKGIGILTTALAKRTQLQELNMSWNRLLDNIGLAAVINVSSRLVSLDIGRTGLTAEGIEALGTALRNLTQLEKLVTRQGVSPTIARLDDYFASACPHLRMLNGIKLTPTVPHTGSLMEAID